MAKKKTTSQKNKHKPTKVDLVPPDLDRCQVMQYHPFTCGGKLYRECGKKPSWVIYETKAKHADGQKGSMSCCQECRAEWEERSGKGVNKSWKWKKIVDKRTV